MSEKFVCLFILALLQAACLYEMWVIYTDCWEATISARSLLAARQSVLAIVLLTTLLVLPIGVFIGHAVWPQTVFLVVKEKEEKP